MYLKKVDPSQLLELREKLRKLEGYTQTQAQNLNQKEFLICDTLPAGVPRGVLCEIIGSARTEWILRLIQQNPELNTFWAEEKLTLLPTAVHQRGIDLNRILMAETGDKLVQTLRKALKSKLFDCVVLPGSIQEVKILKALQLFAKESHACVFLLSRVRKNAWSIPFQIDVNWDRNMKGILVQVLKSKFSSADTDLLSRVEDQKKNL